MWARKTTWFGESHGKYHWFRKEARDPGSMRAALCDPGVRMYPGAYSINRRKQPRRADRCKRCVAALERRKDVNANR